MPDATVHTETEVIDHVNGPLYRVKLPNGKPILAHLSKQLSLEKAVFATGDKLRVEMTPYDFDHGRILGKIG